jgi:hypothetical protein
MTTKSNSKGSHSQVTLNRYPEHNGFSSSATQGNESNQANQVNFNYRAETSKKK